MAWIKLDATEVLACGHESDEKYEFPKTGKLGKICRACNQAQFKAYREARKARSAAPQVPVTGWMPVPQAA